MKRHILLTLLATLATLAATADGLHRPRLVVGIVVEGLSTDCLDLLRPQFIDGGFNRLRSSGMAFDDIDYGSNMDATAATALALTGAAPSVNGVGGAHVYDTEKKAAFPTFLDPTIFFLFLLFRQRQFIVHFIEKFFQEVTVGSNSHPTA